MGRAPDKSLSQFRFHIRRPLFLLRTPNSREAGSSDIMSCMARGWESKSVEAQQAEADEKSAKPGPSMSAEEAARWRKRESLRLSRQVVLQQLEASTNPRHRKLLQDSLADLDLKLRE
jgi:hypothetical protein